MTKKEIEDIIGLLVNVYVSAFTDTIRKIFLKTVKIILNPLNWIPISGTGLPKFIPKTFDVLLDELQEFGTRLQKAALSAIVAVVQTLTPLPRQLKWRVMRADNVGRTCFETIERIGLNAALLQLPFHIAIAGAINSKLSLLSKILNSVPILKFLEPGFAKLVFTAARIITVNLTVGGVFCLVSAAIALGQELVEERPQILSRLLGQGAPRRKVRIVGGGVILRRVPGGSPP